MISWAAKSLTFSPEELLALGHHVSNAHTASMIYSRDNQIALCVKLHRMLQRIRSGTFPPDRPCVTRLFESAAEIKREEDPPVVSSVQASDSSDSSDDSEVAESEEGEEPVHKMPRAEAASMAVEDCKAHKISSIIRVTRVLEEDRLGCGRFITANFRDATPRNLSSSWAQRFVRPAPHI